MGFRLFKTSLVAKLSIPKLNHFSMIGAVISQAADLFYFHIRPSQKNVSFPIALPLVKVGRSVGQKKRNVLCASEGRTAKYESLVTWSFRS